MHNAQCTMHNAQKLTMYSMQGQPQPQPHMMYPGPNYNIHLQQGRKHTKDVIIGV